MHKSVSFADFHWDCASQCTNCFWKYSLKSPATLDLGANSSASGPAKHLSTQTVPLGQSLSYSQRDEWKIIQHGWVSTRTRQEETCRQNTQMTECGWSDGWGADKWEIRKVLWDPSVARRSGRGVLGCMWTEQAAGAWGCPGSQQNHQKTPDLSSGNLSWAKRCPCSSAELTGDPQGKSKQNMALGRGLCFIPAVLLTSSVHLGDVAGNPSRAKCLTVLLLPASRTA